jgi:purine-nucleoside/S-methyl-5'-thioadenosine phosphorylase / adenosine deaminase
VAITRTSRKASRTRQASKSAAALGRVGAAWRLRKLGGIAVLQLEPLAKFPWLVHGFSTRSGGTSTLDGQKVLNLSFMEWDAKENVVANRKLLQKAVGAADFTLVVMKQIHSDVIHPFETVPRQACKGDASITKAKELLLATQTADCLPILLVDPKKKVVAAIHAGWRGTLARIAQKTVGRMQLEFGCQPRDLLAAAGPSIGGCCYEVGAEFVSKFAAQFADAAEYFDEARTGEEPNPLQWLNMAPPGHQPPPKNVHLDLRKANRSQLLAAGVKDKNIFVSDQCTACRSNLFFSYRKESVESGRMLSVIGIRAK